MASVGEEDPPVFITPSTDPVLRSGLDASSLSPDKETITSEVSISTADAIPAKSAGSRVRGILLRMWQARGFFGGLIAIALAYNGQKLVMEQTNAADLALRYYIAAFVILILSLLHPTFSGLKFLRRKKSVAAASASTPLVLEPGLNGNGTANGISNGVHAPLYSNGTTLSAPPAVVADNLPQVPVRKARGSESIQTAALITDGASLPQLPVRKARGTIALPEAEYVPLASRPLRTGPITTPLSSQSKGSIVTSDGNGSSLDAVLAPLPTRKRAASLPASRAIAAAVVTAPGPKQGLWTRWVALRAARGWWITLPLFLVTLALVIGSFLTLHARIEDVFGGWLWFAAMLLLVLTFAGAPRWPRALDGVLDGPDEGFFSKGITRSSIPIEAVFVVIMLAVAIALRVWNLESFPGIFGDEGERGTDALGLLQGHTDSLFGTGWWEVPNLYFYILAGSFRIFGANMVGDRMPSVISGVITIWAIYRIGRLLWGPRVGIIAGSLLAVSPLWLQFSREAGESTPTVMFWALGFLFLFRALRFRHWVDWALSGLAFGFSLYFYAAGKMVVPLVAIIGVYLFIRWRWEFIKRYAVGYGLLVFGFILAPLPYLILISANHFAAFFSRAQETSIFSPGLAAQVFTRYNIPYNNAWAGLSTVQNVLQHPTVWAQVIFNQARISSEALYRIGDVSFFYPLHNHPGGLLSPIIACLTLLGIAYFAWKSWDGRYALNMIWFCAGMCGIIFTIDVPTIQRMVDAWPVIFLFPAVVIDRIMASAWPLNIHFARRWLLVPAIALAVFAAVDGYNEYFVVYASQCSFCNATAQAYYVKALGQDYKGYQMGVGAYNVYFTYGSTRFYAQGVEGEDLNVPMDNFPVTDNNKKGLAFMVYPNNAQYLPLITQFYPGGQQEDVKGSDGSFQFTSYKLTSEQVAKFQATNATYTDSHGGSVQRLEPNLGMRRPLGETAWSSPDNLVYPVTATWEGGLVAPDYGQYTFTFQGAANAHFDLDGKQVLANTGTSGTSITLILAKGVHIVQVKGVLPNNKASIDLLWSGGKGTPQAIAASYLYNGITGGLSGVLSLDSSQAIDAPDPFAKQIPFMRQTNSFLGIKDASASTASFNRRPFLAQWQGSINISVAGQYAFSIDSSGPNMLSIDGQVLLNTGSHPGIGNNIALTEGQHTVDIRYEWQGRQGGSFEWYWQPPGQGKSIVPPSILRPLARSWAIDEVPAPASIPNVAPPPPPSQPIVPVAILGANEGIKEARGVGVDAQGHVYVGDNINHRILVLNDSGNTITSWGTSTNGSAQGRFNLLGDIWTTPAGHTFTLDSGNGDVQEFNPDGSVANYFKGVASASGGITVSPNGKIYIANTVNNQILVLSSDGTILTHLGGGPVGSANYLAQPIDVAIGPDGHTVYAVDMNSRIVQLDDTGNVVREWPVQIGYAQGGSHLVSWRNLLVMSDPDHDRLVVLDPATGDLHLVGISGNSANQMHMPVGLAVGSDDKLYVTDSGNNRILVFSDLNVK